MYKRSTYPTYVRLFLFFLLTFLLQETCISGKQEGCGPSSCGKITNISSPFRLEHDPPNCGKPGYELACENNIAVLYLFPGTPYYVESINYNNFTIRLVDPGVQRTDCSSIPRNFLSRYNHFDITNYEIDYVEDVIFLNCSNGVSNRDYPEYVDTASCINWNSTGHIYAIVGGLTAEKLNVDCRVMAVKATSLWGTRDYNKSFSYIDIHKALLFGFEVSWVWGVCEDYCEQMGCYYNATSTKLECYSTYGKWEKLAINFIEYVYGAYQGLLRIVGRDSLQDRNFKDLPILLGVITGQYLLTYVVARFLFEDGGMDSGIEASSDVNDSNTNQRENASDPLLENSV
ncbi:hypothetical protein L6164_002036 [Bauhinia variegata]|nr:hypothetical protein L6164_002036 [Bauhinia variegata]